MQIPQENLLLGPKMEDLMNFSSLEVIKCKSLEATNLNIPKNDL